MRVVKTVAFTDGLSCERCLNPISEDESIAMLVESLSECGDTIIWCGKCADDVAAETNDREWVDGAHYRCMQCGFTLPTTLATKGGWLIDPGGVGIYCFFCAYESEVGPQMSLPLSSSTIPQEKGSLTQGRFKVILWVATGLQMVLIWDIGIEWLSIAPLSALGFLGARLRRLYARELGYLRAAVKRLVTK